MSFPESHEDPEVGEEFGEPAVVTVADINFTDEKGKYTTSASDTSMWTDYQVRNRYEGDKHIYMMGLTSPNGFRKQGQSRGQCVGFVQLAHPTLLWVCEWTACRFNEQPIIPNPDVQNSNWVLMDVCPETFSLGLSPDGVTPLYRISGVYVYGHVCPNEVTVNDINYPRNPWMRDDFDRTVSPSTLQQNISNISGQAGKNRGGNLGSRKGL